MTYHRKKYNQFYTFTNIFTCSGTGTKVRIIYKLKYVGLQLFLALSLNSFKICYYVTGKKDKCCGIICSTKRLT